MTAQRAGRSLTERAARSLAVIMGGLFLWGRVSAAQDAVPANADSLADVTIPFATDIWSFFHFIFALAIVLVLLILTLWVLKRIASMRGSGLGSEVIAVVAMRYIEPKKAIAVIRVAGRHIIIGITDHSITSLGELTAEETGTLAIDSSPPSGVFTTILERFTGTRSRTGSEA